MHFASQQQSTAALVEGIDELTIRQIRRQLDFLRDPELRALRRYEAAHKNRRSLLREIDRRLAPRSH
jgi:hypothetical protein